VKFATQIINRVWLGGQLLAHRRFNAALAKPRHCQESILGSYIKANAATEFGRRHDFAHIRSVGDFQQRVPLSNYDDYTAAIARIGNGERNVLSTSPVRMLEPSSGSTSARKLVPYTAQLQTEIRRAIAPWLVDLARSVPSIRNGRSYWAITPTTGHELEAGSATEPVPVGFDSDSAYLGGWLAWMTSRVLLNCEDLSLVSDIGEFRRLTLLRLLAAPDLRLISVWHPTFFVLLLDELVASWPALLRDLETGVRPAGPVRGVSPNRARARKLAGVDPHYPESIWPELAVVSCWGDGHAARDCAALARYFPGTMIQSKGLLATEACISIPFAEKKPLAIRSHFFEFIDANENAKTSWELDQGESYSVVVTTGSGFCRYRLHDRIVVDGFVKSTPSIRFVGKEDSVSDLRGEKLSEAFVAGILGRLLPTLAPDAGFAMLAPSITAAMPRYTLFVDSDYACDDKMRIQLESELERNPNYAHCVHLGQLGSVGILRVGADATERYVERLRNRGQRLGVIKPIALSPLTDWEEILVEA